MTEYLMISDPWEEDDIPATFTVSDDNAADWALSKIAEEQKQRDRIRATAEEKIAWYQKRIEDADRAYNNSTVYLKAALADYMEKVKAKETKTQKTYALASGKLIYKKPSKKVVRDEEALLSFAKESAPDFVETVEKVKWGDLKKTLTETESGYVTADGELVKGVTLEDVPASFDVKVGEF